MLFLQPRDVCYVADEGLTDLKYSGHQPHAHSWDEFPVLKDILKVVSECSIDTLHIVIVTSKNYLADWQVSF